MAIQRSCKIFVQLADERCDLFWVNITRDRSVVLGASYKGTQTVHLAIEEGNFYEPGDLITEPASQNAKITFHYSGNYKISARVGRTEKSMDRCTIVGPPLPEIGRPRRMAEIILPRVLAPSKKPVGDLDVVLDARRLPPGPLRCTLWCCNLEHFDEFMRNPFPIVDTSTAELTSAFEDGERAWAFTLRTSREDTTVDEGFYFHIPGKLKWGSADNAV